MMSWQPQAYGTFVLLRFSKKEEDSVLFDCMRFVSKQNTDFEPVNLE